MKKYNFLLLTLFVGSFCFSQQQTTNNNFIPVSIYTSSFQLTADDTPSYSSINKDLNFKKQYKFSTVSFEEIDDNQFLISTENLTTKATKFIYDDYKSYRDENLLKGFLQKHDPTRWDPINFKQPNLN
ncbi:MULTISPECIES: hypothetical protein [Polaribacter]|uniref:GLPGLI family protein n=1 Tax=Polaribacter sejongensis TaxID=985043 RepID=A0AAJ1VF88_9FLAO|nr:MULTISPECIES: hypothetical protein [Polaribacter]MDN3618461.1 hypothetical protein [Polaribacter undariae]UWD30556.1 hypothetical protein NQP51_10440 [Polaribacter undariae]